MVERLYILTTPYCKWFRDAIVLMTFCDNTCDSSFNMWCSFYVLAEPWIKRSSLKRLLLELVIKLWMGQCRGGVFFYKLSITPQHPWPEMNAPIHDGTMPDIVSITKTFCFEIQLIKVVYLAIKVSTSERLGILLSNATKTMSEYCRKFSNIQKWPQ